MDENKTIIIAVLVILAIGVISFSFSGITGSAVSDGEKRISKIYVSSSEDVAITQNPRISKGGIIYVTVETGSEGSDNMVGFYLKDGDKYRRRATTELEDGCGGGKCRKNRVVSKKYKLNADFEGTYCARVLDKAIDKQVEACFFIR
tara:strand:- start:2509 stop:2949 length:441 start_codon:yes stop_codon:yes gene_type:complete